MAENSAGRKKSKSCVFDLLLFVVADWEGHGFYAW